ncbi:hypothetical protein FHY04_000863 [Sphingomonas sp. BK481]|nr:hypothetical protein [Sphingomonas sp. BK481]
MATVTCCTVDGVVPPDPVAVSWYVKVPDDAGDAVRPVLITVPLMVHDRAVTDPLLTLPAVAAKVVVPAVPVFGLMLGCEVKDGAGVGVTVAAVKPVVPADMTATLRELDRQD